MERGRQALFLTVPRERLSLDEMFDDESLLCRSGTAFCGLCFPSIWRSLV